MTKFRNGIILKSQWTGDCTGLKLIIIKKGGFDFMDKRDLEYKKKVRKIRVRKNRKEKRERGRGKIEEDTFSASSPVAIKKQIDIYKLKRELEKDIARLLCNEKITEGSIVEIEFPAQDIAKLASEEKEVAGSLEIELFPLEDYLFYIEIKEIVENTKNLFAVCTLLKNDDGEEKNKNDREIILDLTNFIPLLKTCKETKNNKMGCNNCDLNQ